MIDIYQYSENGKVIRRIVIILVKLEILPDDNIAMRWWEDKLEDYWNKYESK